jgi:hypothetical protein
LRRLRSIETLRGGIAAGISLLTWSTETFAYAEELDASGRYLGLRAGAETSGADIDVSKGLLVRADVAVAQRDSDARFDGESRRASSDNESTRTSKAGSGTNADAAGRDGTTDRPSTRSVFLNVKIDDPTRLTRVAAQIATDIVAHLHAVRGSRIEVSIDITGEFSDGLAPEIVDRVRRNAAAHGFPEVETTT